MNFHLVVIFQSIKYIKDLLLFIQTKNNYLIVHCWNCFICLVFLKMAKKLNKNELTSLSSKSKVQCSEPKSDVKSKTKKKKKNRYCSMCSNHSVRVPTGPGNREKAGSVNFISPGREMAGKTRV